MFHDDYSFDRNWILFLKNKVYTWQGGGRIIFLLAFFNILYLLSFGPYYCILLFYFLLLMTFHIPYTLSINLMWTGDIMKKPGYKLRVVDSCINALSMPLCHDRFYSFFIKDLSTKSNLWSYVFMRCPIVLSVMFSFKSLLYLSIPCLNFWEFWCTFFGIIYKQFCKTLLFNGVCFSLAIDDIF